MVITKTKSDAELRRWVMQELEWDPRVDSPGISVEVTKGIVTLRGSVGSYAKQVAAREAVHHVAGVLDVADELLVRSASVIKSDQELAQSVRHALRWDTYVPDTRIQSTVADGWVTLEGEVERIHEREEAARAIHRIIGLRGLTNRIVVKPSAVDPARIRTAIEDALKRRAEREVRRIHIEVEGSTVRLSGSVDSWGERHAIEELACNSPGVSKVEDTILVDPYL